MSAISHLYNNSMKVSPLAADNAPKHSSKQTIKKIAGKVFEATKFVFKVLLGLGLFYINPTLFAVGFIVGLVATEKVKKTMEKIEDILKKMPWQTALIVGTAAALSLPVTLGAGAALYGACLGYRLVEKVRQ